MYQPPLRPDYERMAARRWDDRKPDRLRVHYKLERDLAGQIHSAHPQDRLALYSVLYNQLFASLPDHPQHTNQALAPSERVEGQLKALRSLVDRDTVFLEIGCGDGALTQAMAPLVKRAYGLDVTQGLLIEPMPENFGFLLSGGLDVPLADASVDLVYSNQLMEHLHPEDAAMQLKEIYRVLKPGGRYYCVTPSRLTGPHDISCYFDYESTGFHLKEYDFKSLAASFAGAGFAKTEFFASLKGRLLPVPRPIALMIEGLLDVLPKTIKSTYVHLSPVRNFLGLRAMGVKPIS